MALRNIKRRSRRCVIIFAQNFLPRFTQRRRNLCAHPLLITLAFSFALRRLDKLQSATQTTHYAAMIILLLCNNREAGAVALITEHMRCSLWLMAPVFVKKLLEACAWNFVSSEGFLMKMSRWRGENFTASLGSRVTAGILMSCLANENVSWFMSPFAKRVSRHLNAYRICLFVARFKISNWVFGTCVRYLLVGSFGAPKRNT